MAANTNESQMEWAQRELSDLHINENQGRPNLIKNPPNYFNTPIQRTPQPTMETQRHRQELEPTKYHNRQIDPHAFPATQSYRSSERPHSNQMNTRPSNQPPSPNPHRTTPNPPRIPTPTNVRQYEPPRQSPAFRSKSNTPTNSFHAYRETTNNPNLSFSTIASTSNEHNATQIPRTHNVMIHKPRLPYPVPTKRPQTHDSSTTAQTKPQSQINPQYTYRRSPIHQDKYCQQIPNTPTMAHNEQNHQNIQHHTPNFNYLEQEIPRQYPLRRSPALQNLKVVDDIQTILTNDQFIKDLESDNLSKHISESDSDSGPGFVCQPRTQRRTPPQAKPRQYTTRPTESRRLIDFSPPAQQHQNLQNKTKTNTNTKTNTTQADSRYTILYDEENLFCHGKGWKNKFLAYPNKTLLKSIKANLQLSDATTFNTEAPFSDLHTQINHTVPNKTQIPQSQPNTTTSSDTSIQNLLSSTINESSPPQCIQPTASPITKNVQQLYHTNPRQENNPQDIQHSMEQFEQTDITLRSAFQPHQW